MSAPFQPGDLVVCVDASVRQSDDPASLWHWPLKLQAIFRITEIEDCYGQLLVNLTVDPPSYVDVFGWQADRFRKIDDGVDEAFREQMRALKPLKQGERV